MENVAPSAVGQVPASAGARVRALVATVWDGAIAGRVREGRLRDVGWPRGLRALLALGCALGVVAAIMVVASGWLRAHSTLTVSSTLSSATPDALVWILIFFLVAALALFHTAALHGPWWLRVVALIATGTAIASWGLQFTSPPAVLAAETLIILVVVTLTVLWGRGTFRWWEFPVLLALIGGGVALGLAELDVSARQLGFELAPVYLNETLRTLAVVVLPASIAAGTAVAEVSVGVTLVAVRQAERLPGRIWPYVLLAVAAGARLGQAGWEAAHLDPVRQGWLAFLPAAATLAVLAGVSLLVVRIARARGGAVVVSELPTDLGRISLPVGAALVALLVPILLVSLLLAIAVSIAPTSGLRNINLDLSFVLGPGVDVVRVLLAAALLGLAIRQARRGRATPAVLLGCVAVMLAAHSMRVLTGGLWALRLDADVLNLLATAVAFGLIGWYVVRRRLTVLRALAGAALLLLSLVYSARALLTDPIGEIFGYSGVALVLFGVFWDFLTGSEWGNEQSRRFPRSSRVLLLLTNSLLLLIILAYSSLIRDPESVVNVDTFAELGNVILGTGLLAAAYVTVVGLATADRPLT